MSVTPETFHVPMGGVHIPTGDVTRQASTAAFRLARVVNTGGEGGEGGGGGGEGGGGGGGSGKRSVHVAPVFHKIQHALNVPVYV